MELRPYQKEALSALWGWFRANPTGAPLIVLPTGAGKSLVLAEVARLVAEKGEDRRVLVVAHRKELLQQNREKFVKLAPGVSSGVYSAGLKQRDTTSQVIFAGVQSVYKKAAELGRFSLVIVDEAHLIPSDGEGIYHTLFAGLTEQNHALRVVGLTATPYRLGAGFLCGADRLFTDVCYDANIGDLIRQGYLSPLVSKSCVSRPDLRGVSVRAGEYVQEQLEGAFNRLDLVEAAVEEICVWGRDRKSWLIFASGVSHAENVAKAVSKAGVSCAVLTGETGPVMRELFLSGFKNGEIQCLVNVEVLTTGFDHPGVDLVAVLRATKSTGLWVQVCGRGSRLAAGKKDCLILDFGQNAVTHGPLDKIRITYRRNPITGSKEGEVTAPPMKECLVCRSVVGIAAKECPDCGSPFAEVAPIRHEAKASDAPIMSDQPAPTKLVEVLSTKYKKHENPAKPLPTLRVDYVLSQLADVPVSSISEWVCFEHEGFPRGKAVSWWKERVSTGEDPIPETIDEALTRTDELREAKKIEVQKDGKFWRVLRVYEWNEEISQPAWMDDDDLPNL